MAPREHRSRARTWPAQDRRRAHIVPSETGIWPAFGAQLRGWVRAEAGPGRLLPWTPVAFGAGIAVYFAADREPVAWIATMATAALALIAIAIRRHAGFALVVMLTALSAGFATAALKTARVAHGVLARPMLAVAVKGFVETREERERTDRFVLRIETLERSGSVARDPPALQRVRLSVKKGTAPPVGSFVELKARLLPPLAPLRVGGYDFARDMYFQGIGASGFVMGAISVVAPPKPAGYWLRYAAAMQGLRDGIDARIRSVLSGDTRAIATALLTGKRDAISTPVNDAMFISGLGHVLSISGYHMAVVAGAVFFAIRALLALAPALAVTFPIKKWAAAGALAASAFYLLLSGAEVATQRSFLMTAVVLIAIMVDRRAVTFRTLAVAAMAVMIVTPEAVVHPSFQMSFAATLALVALVSIGWPLLLATPDNNSVARAALWGGRELTMLALASLVAGLATMPYAAYHFHRVTPYGVIANLVAMPVVSVVVMPFGLFGLAAIPFGLDAPFWRVMEWGIVWMVAVAQWTAALPGAIGRVPAFGPGPLLIASAGIVVVALLRTPLRWAGAPMLLVAGVLAWQTPRPDIFVSADGRGVAVRGKDGRLHIMRTGTDAFLTREWLAADADARSLTDVSLAEGVSCDSAGCVSAMRDGRLVALALQPQAFADDCTAAAIIVTSRQPPRDCAALVIRQDQRGGSGAIAIRHGQDGSFMLERQASEAIDRPWARTASRDGSPVLPAPDEAVSGRRVPVDSTPLESDLQADD